MHPCPSEIFSPGCALALRDLVGTSEIFISKMNDRPQASIAFLLGLGDHQASAATATSDSRCGAVNLSITAASS